MPRYLGPGSRYSPEEEDVLNSFDEYGYGLRGSGAPKGQGWLGPLQMANGDTATELTIGVDGEDIPLLMPTLDKDEIEYILAGNRATRSMVNKAAEFARSRRRQGFSTYAD